MATAKKKAAAKPTAQKTPEIVPTVVTPLQEDKRVVPIKPGDVKLMDQMHQNWACFAPSHYDQEMLEDPKYWTFMATRFKDMDSIRITAEDGSYIALGYIRRSQTMEVMVQITDIIPMQEQMIAKELDINGYLIKHFGSVRRFCVVNKETREVIKENFQTQLQAMKYVSEHILVQQAAG